MADKNIQFSINDGKSFFADEISVTNNPVKIIIDFKNTSPRIDVRSNQGSIPIVVEHNTVIMDPYLAKSFKDVLENHLSKYEEKFGEITEPPQLKQAKEEAQEVSSADAKQPGYFG